MKKNQIIIVLFLVAILLAAFFGHNVKVFKYKNSELLTSSSSTELENAQMNVKKGTCEDILYREQKPEVKGYKFFTECNFVSGEYGDNDSKNIFGVENVKTGKKYIIGSRNGIFDQNTILDVIDDRYIFLVNSYEGESRYIMIDINEVWPTHETLMNTVYPRTIDQYIKAKIKYSDIINRF